MFLSLKRKNRHALRDSSPFPLRLRDSAASKGRREENGERIGWKGERKKRW